MKYNETDFDLTRTIRKKKANEFLVEITYLIFLPNGTKLI